MKRLVALLTLVSLTASAAEGGLTHLPKWTLYQGRACYDFEGARQLLLADLTLDGLLDEKETRLKLIDDLGVALAKNQEALRLSEQKALLHETRAQELAKRLELALREKNQAEAERGPSFGWTAAGALLLVGSGLALGLYVSTR